MDCKEVKVDENEDAMKKRLWEIFTPHCQTSWCVILSQVLGQFTAAANYHAFRSNHVARFD